MTMKKHNDTNKISRQEAIIRMGKYAAITSIGTFVILNPLKSQASSPPDPGNDFPID